MRIDVVTIFPDYLAPLDLSLVGRARREGLLDLRVHDLRAWTTDRHRTVDDTPFGGGAGMVMRPDVWGRALDELVPATIPATTDGRPVLLLPTPSGAPLTQRTVEELAGRERLVIACGRYEGIDARVAEHYRERGADVREVSLGDYVLNGGEVAALVLVEAVVRLLPGVVGNPNSLVEESHGSAGLLEYPVYTRPPDWAGHEVPGVLTSGHHGDVARWRRDQALARTVERRPDMVEAIDPDGLDGADRAVLAAHDVYVPAASADGTARPTPVRIRPGGPDDAVDVAALAARTFPLACPPSLPAEDARAFVEAHLRPEHFAAYLADAERYRVHVAESPDGPVGYTLLVLPRAAYEPPYLDEVAAVVPQRPAAELSKVYVESRFHGTGLAGALLENAATVAAAHTVDGEPVAVLWLGTHEDNRRARRSYARHGWTLVGRRDFHVGSAVEHDVVMARPLR